MIARVPRSGRVLRGISGHHVVRHDRSGPVEPERRDLRQDFAFVGNAGTEHVVEGRDAIARDDEQAVAELVDVADFALTIGQPAGNRRLKNR